MRKKEVRESGIAEFGRCGRRSDPGFSEGENVDCASFSKISDSSIFERVGKRNVECTYIGGRRNRSGLR
jgi:hypothetical protein